MIVSNTSLWALLHPLLLVTSSLAVAVPKAVHFITGVVVVPPLKTEQFAVFAPSIVHDGVPLLAEPDILKVCVPNPVVSQTVCGVPALAVAFGFSVIATSAVAVPQDGV